MNYNERTKQHRIDARLTLRAFCQLTKLDPSNWSKVERGINPPPKDQSILDRVADVLNLDADQRQEYFDAAAVARNEFPKDIITNEAIVAKLPAFFRAMRGQEPDPKDLEQMIEDIRNLHTPDPD